LDQLPLTLVKDHDGAAILDRPVDQPWLFPGRTPGRPRSARQLRTRLAAYGLPARRGRDSALLNLAGQMPPAVLSQVLGVDINTADGWPQPLVPAVRRTPPSSADAHTTATTTADQVPSRNSGKAFVPRDPSVVAE